MATNLDIVTGALRFIGIVAETETPSAEQGGTGLAMLSAMLLTWQAEGIVANVVPQTDLADTFPLEQDRTLGAQACLAVLLAPMYGRDPPLFVARLADAQYTRFLGEGLTLTMPEKRNARPWGEGQVSVDDTLAFT